jgi:hypothetical protein
MLSGWVRSASLAPELRASLAREAARVRGVVAGGAPGAAPAANLLARSAQPPTASAHPEWGTDADRPVLAPGERQRIIDDAVRFVQDRVRRHGLRLALVPSPRWTRCCGCWAPRLDRSDVAT